MKEGRHVRASLNHSVLYRVIHPLKNLARYSTLWSVAAPWGSLGSCARIVSGLGSGVSKSPSWTLSYSAISFGRYLSGSNWCLCSPLYVHTPYLVCTNWVCLLYPLSWTWPPSAETLNETYRTALQWHCYPPKTYPIEDSSPNWTKWPWWWW